MPPNEEFKTIQCPKCRAEYKVKADLRGTLRCKKCNAGFAVGVSASSREAAKTRDETDKRMAVKLVVVGGIALAIVALIIVVASGKAPGSGSSEATRKRGNLPAYDPSKATRTNAEIPPSPQPRAIAREFLKAIAAGDKTTLERIYDFETYFKWWDEKAKAPEAGRYPNLTPEEQKTQRDLALENMLDPEFQEFVKSRLLPELDAGNAKAVVAELTELKTGSYKYKCTNAEGQDLLTVEVAVDLRRGKDPATDGLAPDAWAVVRATARYHLPTVKVEKPDKFGVDIAMERADRRAKAEARKRGGGFPEADPVLQKPVDGTGPTQQANIESFIAKVLDPATSGPEFFAAREQLLGMGKLAIPFLLNFFVGKDHKGNEQHIKDCVTISNILEDLTGAQGFGYSPMSGGLGGVNAADAGDVRERAVRRWFGWWQRNRLSFVKRPESKDEPEGK